MLQIPESRRVQTRWAMKQYMDRRETLRGRCRTRSGRHSLGACRRLPVSVKPSYRHAERVSRLSVSSLTDALCVNLAVTIRRPRAADSTTPWQRNPHAEVAGGPGRPRRLSAIMRVAPAAQRPAGTRVRCERCSPVAALSRRHTIPSGTWRYVASSWPAAAVQQASCGRGCPVDRRDPLSPAAGRRRSVFR